MHCRSGASRLRRVLTISALAAVAFAFAPTLDASAYTLTTLHTFCSAANCSDGAYPWGGLLQDQSGDFYGMTNAGGKYLDGVVFELVPNGSSYKEQVLHNFCARADCTDGRGPLGDLIMDMDGNLYGTTQYGGAYDAGTIFKLTRGDNGWSLSVLHNFCRQANCTDGKSPQTALVMADQRHFFGTTPGGGAHGDGTAYELTHNMDGTWSYAVIYSFCAKANCADGGPPKSDLIVDKDGRLYGTTLSGGAGQGNVYRLQHTGTGWTETVIVDFCTAGACKLGRSPTAGLSYAGQRTGAAWDESSPLFGTTSGGGKHDHGAVFELVHDSSGWTYSVLRSFDVGIGPGALTVSSGGNLYGTTFNSEFPSNAGLAFKLAHDTWAETVLYVFCTGTCDQGDGDNPSAARPIIDANGNVFSTTVNGISSSPGGTVFKLTP